MHLLRACLLLIGLGAIGGPALAAEVHDLGDALQARPTGWEAADPEPGWSGLTRPQAVRPLQSSLHPDARAIRYRGVGQRWQAAAGARLFLFGHETPTWGARTTWAGFIELHNLRQGGPVPWELFRAHVGFQLHLYAHGLEARLPGTQRFDLMLGWFHESDHAAATQALFREVTIVSTDPEAEEQILNANMSSFEFFEARLAWQSSFSGDKVRTQVVPLARLYPRPLAWVWSQRRMLGTLAVEGRVSLRAVRRLRPYVGGVAEVTTYRRGPDEVVFNNGYVDGPRSYLSAEVGAEIWSRGGMVLSPHISVVRMHGRGIDWFRDYGTMLALGVRATP